MKNLSYGKVLITLFAVAMLQGTCSRCRAQGRPAAASKKIPGDSNSGCSGRILVFPIPWGSQQDEAAVKAGRAEIRARFLFRGGISAEVVERPKTMFDFRTEIVIRNGKGKARHYHIAKALGANGSWRLWDAAEICSGPTKKRVVLQYVGNPIGVPLQGFVILQYVEGRIHVYTLPQSFAGEIVVYRRRPTFVQIWTAGRAVAGMMPLDLARRFYVIRPCHLVKDSFVCAKKGRAVGPHSPGVLDDPGIEVR